jgi:hypothetical protein
MASLLIFVNIPFRFLILWHIPLKKQESRVSLEYPGDDRKTVPQSALLVV